MEVQAQGNFVEFIAEIRLDTHEAFVRGEDASLRELEAIGGSIELAIQFAMPIEQWHRVNGSVDVKMELIANEPLKRNVTIMYPEDLEWARIEQAVEDAFRRCGVLAPAFRFIHVGPG